MAIGAERAVGVVIEAAEEVAVNTLEWASDTGGTPINAASTEWFNMVNIQVSVTFLASSSLDAEVHVRKSVDNATTEDTPEQGTYLGTIPNPGGAGTVIKTWSVYDFDYLDVGVKNLEAATYTITYSAKYDGWKTTGMA